MTTEIAFEKVRQFLDSLVPDGQERRADERIPFTQRVTLYFDDSEVPVQVTVRDISASGIGFIHDMPLEPREATVRITVESGTSFCGRVQILWSKEAARGCYLSGARFVSVFDDDPLDKTAAR